MEKYWPEHPEIIYSTESVINPYYKTICKPYEIDMYSKRFRETVEEIDDNYILEMVDDVFIRQPVDNQEIINLTKYFNHSMIAAINFEIHFDKNDIELDDNIMIRSKNGMFKNSLMCQLWNKNKLLDTLCNINTNPWDLEELNNHKNYTYLITKYKHFIDWGYRGWGTWFGIYRGKWCPECISFAQSENIYLNLNRGIHQ